MEDSAFSMASAKALKDTVCFPIQVQEYKERPQLVATIGPKKRCQYCLFRGTEVEVIPMLPLHRHPHISHHMFPDLAVSAI